MSNQLIPFLAKKNPKLVDSLPSTDAVLVSSPFPPPPPLQFPFLLLSFSINQPINPPENCKLIKYIHTIIIIIIIYLLLMKTSR
jgi:hypothetical protein